MKKIITLTLLIFCYLGVFAQVPVNDDCAMLVDLGEVPNCNPNTVYTNVNATPSVISADPN